MDAAELVRAYTAVERVPLAPEIRVHCTSELTPLWRVTSRDEAALRDARLGLPYWSVPWPGGQALARWLLDHPASVSARRVIDFGTGGGLVAIAAAKAGAAEVVAVDIDPLACAACRVNAALNEVVVDVIERDVVGTHVDVDVVLAGDVWYEREPAARFDAWLRELAAAGVIVLTGDPGRSYVPAGLVELARYEVPTTRELEGASAKATRVLAYR